MKLISSPARHLAFKILAAGRLSGRAVDQAFQTAFESIKPTDGVFVGRFHGDGDDADARPSPPYRKDYAFNSQPARYSRRRYLFASALLVMRRATGSHSMRWLVRSAI